MAGSREIISMPSMRCDGCDVFVRSFEGQMDHSKRTSHNSWTFSEVEVRGLRCAKCSELCGSQRIYTAAVVAIRNSSKSLIRNSKGKVVHSSAGPQAPLRGEVHSSAGPQAPLRELVPPELLKILTDMGYPEAHASRALRSCDTNNVEVLINWLVEHEDHPDIDTPELSAMKEWSNLVTEEMKVRSRKLREDAVKRTNTGKAAVKVTQNPILYTKRLLKYEITLSEKKLEQLKKKFVIAEDIDELVVVEKINKALEACDIANGIFSFRLPSQSDSLYTYDPTLQQLCLKKGKTYICSTNSKIHYKKALRIGTLLLLIRRLILDKESIRLRWIYYLDPMIYNNQDASDAAVAAVSLLFEGTRSSFNIRPSPRGSIIGPVMLCDGDTILVNCTLGAVSGSNIPSEAEKINRVIQLDQVDFILIVEKETVFHKLSDMGFHKKHNCILVTASGEPDVATRVALKKLKTWLDVPICALVDANLEGFDILCTYRFGSINRAYDNLSLTLPDLVWIGVFCTDIAKEDQAALSSKEIKKLDRLVNKVHIQVVEPWCNRLHQMSELGKKGDIESLVRSRKLEDYIMEKVRPFIVK